jgi:hypothetical protein
MAINTYPYPLGGNNGQHRGSTAQASGGSAVGTGAGNVGTNTAAGGAGGGTSSVQGTGASSGGLGWVTYNGPIVSVSTVIMPQPYSPPKDEGIKAGEITAYRAWHITSLHPGAHVRLMSVFASHLWTPGRSEKADREVDDCQSGSGFHAFNTPELCLKQYGLGLITTTGIVYGEIKMWGKVIEHERGYRSEYCKITKLCDLLVYNSYDPDKSLDIICKTYGVEKGQPWGTTSARHYRGIASIMPVVPTIDSRTWTGLE